MNRNDIKKHIKSMTYWRWNWYHTACCSSSTSLLSLWKAFLWKNGGCISITSYIVINMHRYNRNRSHQYALLFKLQSDDDEFLSSLNAFFLCIQKTTVIAIIWYWNQPRESWFIQITNWKVWCRRLLRKKRRLEVHLYSISDLIRCLC